MGYGVAEVCGACENAVVVSVSLRVFMADNPYPAVMITLYDSQCVISRVVIGYHQLQLEVAVLLEFLVKD